MQRRAQQALKRSGIFPLSTLDGYDFAYPKSIDRDLCLRAASLDFIREKANCVFLGPSGVGKTHLANAIGQLACLRGYRVRFVTRRRPRQQPRRRPGPQHAPPRLSAWASLDLLLIDELGYLDLRRPRRRPALPGLQSHAPSATSTIVTTNLPFKDWGKLFSTASAASAIADRLVHKGLLIRIQGKSRRSDQEVE